MCNCALKCCLPGHIEKDPFQGPPGLGRAKRDVFHYEQYFGSGLSEL